MSRGFGDSLGVQSGRDEGTQSGPGLGPKAGLTFAAALAVYLALAGWLVWRTAILEPYSDMFAWMARYYRFQADGDLGHYLWAPHNFHHLVWTFAILALDIRAFGANSYLFLTVGVACLAATAAMLTSVAASAGDRRLRLVGAGGAAALSLMGCYVLDASADINTTYVHALALAVAAILLGEARPGEAPPNSRRVAALLCAIGAGLGSAAGFAVWPALLFGAWRRNDLRWALIVLGMGALFSLSYAVGETSLANPGGVSGDERLIESIALFLNYLGLPWVRGIPDTGWMVGMAVLAAAMAALAFRGRQGAARPERVAVQLIVFSLGTAVMAGVARTGATAPNMVPMRYGVFMTPLHLALWILILPYISRAWTRRPRALEGVVVAAAALMLMHQAVMAVWAVRTADMNRQVIAEFRSGAWTPQMRSTIYFDPATAHALFVRMRRDDLYQRELCPEPRPQRIG